MPDKNQIGNAEDNPHVTGVLFRSHIEIERIRVRADTNYLITTRVTGSGAVGFRFWAEEMD